MVGDGFEKDIRIPNALGVFAVWFNPKSDKVRRDEMHFTVHSMEQLHAFFETLDQN
jgi:FMN phosphatase YigB (HAD superfamily)